MLGVREWCPIVTTAQGSVHCNVTLYRVNQNDATLEVLKKMLQNEL
jgi:hypothetical protein